MPVGYERRKCEYADCTRLTRNKGHYNGRTRYDRFCSWHHRKAGDKRPSPYFLKNSLPNKKCEVCGWDKAFCDRHRRVPDKGYTPDNVVVLCPNCHRLEGLGLLEIT